MDPMTAAAIASLGMAAGGSVLGARGAKNQARKREGAIRGAMETESRLANEMSLNEYRAGGIRTGELLAHLQRLSSAGHHASVDQDMAERNAMIASFAGPEGNAPNNEVAQQAFAQGGQRNALAKRIDLTQALLRLQDRAAGRSGNLAQVSASRAAVPLAEQRAANQKARMLNQMNLQAALGGINGGWESTLGSVLGASASIPLAFAK